MKTTPCKDCPEKGCGSKHDTCEPYQEWCVENRKTLERRSVIAEENGFFMARRMKCKADKYRRDEKH